MADIYGRTPLNYGGGFRHDGASLSISTVGGVGGGAAGGVGQGAAGNLGLALIVQQFSVAYQKRLTKIFEFGNPNFYFVEGPPDGQMQIDNLVGPKGLVLTFARVLGDVCAVEKNLLRLGFGTGCGNNTAQAAIERAAGAAAALLMRFALVDTISLSGEAQTALVRSQARLMFGSLEEERAGAA